MGKAFLLSEDDRNEILKLIRAESERIRNTTGRSSTITPDEQEFFPPEVFIARTPVDGIPALTEATGTDSELHMDEPGAAECYIYRVLWDQGDTAEHRLSTNHNGTPKLVQMGHTGGFIRTVHNVSTADIDGDTWIPVVRDKHGVWWALTGGSSGLSVCGTPQPAGTGTTNEFCDPCVNDPRLYKNIHNLKFDCEFEIEFLEQDDCDGATGTGDTTSKKRTVKIKLLPRWNGESRSLYDFEFCADSCTVVKQFLVECFINGRKVNEYLDPPEMPACPEV